MPAQRPIAPSHPINFLPYQVPSIQPAGPLRRVRRRRNQPDQQPSLERLHVALCTYYDTPDDTRIPIHRMPKTLRSLVAAGRDNFQAWRTINSVINDTKEDERCVR